MSELMPLIPNMTDYNKPSGLVTESGHNASDFGWRAFTDNSGVSRDFWYNISNGEKWVQYDFENEVKLSAVELSSEVVSGSNYGIKNFTIKNMSNNKVLFQGVHPNNDSTIRYEFNSTKTKSVRIDITDSYYSANNVLIRRVQCFEREIIERKFITVDNGSTILSYEDGKVKKSNEVTPSEEIITPFSLENTVDYIEDVNGNITQFNGSFLDFIKKEYDGKFSFLTYTDELTASNCQIQTTHELNLLQDDLLQANEVEILNWSEEEYDFDLSFKIEKEPYQIIFPQEKIEIGSTLSKFSVTGNAKVLVLFNEEQDIKKLNITMTINPSGVAEHTVAEEIIPFDESILYPLGGKESGRGIDWHIIPPIDQAYLGNLYNQAMPVSDFNRSEVIEHLKQYNEIQVIYILDENDHLDKLEIEKASEVKNSPTVREYQIKHNTIKEVE